MFSLVSLLHVVSSLTHKFSQRLARGVFRALYYSLIILTSVSSSHSFVLPSSITFWYHRFSKNDQFVTDPIITKATSIVTRSDTFSDAFCRLDL